MTIIEQIDELAKKFGGDKSFWTMLAHVGHSPPQDVSFDVTISLFVVGRPDIEITGNGHTIAAASADLTQKINAPSPERIEADLAAMGR